MIGCYGFEQCRYIVLPSSHILVFRSPRSRYRSWEGNRQDVCSPASFLPGCLRLVVILLRPHPLPGSPFLQLFSLACRYCSVPLCLQPWGAYSSPLPWSAVPPLAGFPDTRPMPLPESIYIPCLITYLFL